MLENIKQILHPTDFSAPAKNAFIYAREIARKTKSKLTVLHSVKLPYAYGSEKMMEEIIKNNPYKDLSIETRIDFGETVPGILKYAGDLIVMGSTGKSKMGKVLFGSISSKVMLKAPVPVLVVPPELPYSNFDHIIFATDFRDRDLENLSALTEWAKLFDTEITVLHVASDDSMETKIKFRGFKEIVHEEIDYPHVNFRLIQENDFYSGMSAYLHDQVDELVVLSRHKKSFFQNLFNESHIKQTVYTKVPILVLPGEATEEGKNTSDQKIDQT